MSKKRKWEITQLKKTKSFSRSAKIILNDRITGFFQTASKYFENNSVENLHDVRISLRRIRYSMELFLICFEKKLFLRFYNRIEKLQDISGSVRDLDVMLENFNSLQQLGKFEVGTKLTETILNKKNGLEEVFKINLMKFLHSKVYKDFTNSLK